MSTAASLPKFQGVKHLKAWLANSPEGRTILSTLAKDNKVIHYPPILAVQHPDRVEVYSTRKATGKVITAPCNVDSMEAEVWVGDQLPQHLKRIYWPVNKVLTAVPHRMPWQECAYFADKLNFMRDISGISRAIRDIK